MVTERDVCKFLMRNQKLHRLGNAVARIDEQKIPCDAASTLLEIDSNKADRVSPSSLSGAGHLRRARSSTDLQASRRAFSLTPAGLQAFLSSDMYVRSTQCFLSGSSEYVHTEGPYKRAQPIISRGVRIGQWSTTCLSTHAAAASLCQPQQLSALQVKKQAWSCASARLAT